MTDSRPVQRRCADHARCGRPPLLATLDRRGSATAGVRGITIALVSRQLVEHLLPSPSQYVVQFLSPSPKQCDVQDVSPFPWQYVRQWVFALLLQ
jgi:hypothetical protein